MPKGRTRADRARSRESRMPERHHYTDRLSVPVTSNSPVDSRMGGTIANTNLPLSRGGRSCYPRMREGWAGSATPATSRVADDSATKSHKHLI